MSKLNRFRCVTQYEVIHSFLANSPYICYPLECSSRIIEMWLRLHSGLAQVRT
ncbi:Hypothetical protein PP7435_CHR1-2456 [Komagataella phaffii CBS 7435]|uniref:Uncharacterized protein n=1 Tax=Komagataella phaffii (strain ATCC 76273 / CBS 7435 / CECT 11047 / NRRL Y-11430 / Wegner 21-1) TaxID=981350 RepID=A0A1G4KPB7_KOMPC|nr:Hypothetical protein BQ9382_C1-3952 [Komagataella phaffii CBS 7435]SCV11848.1 Hypothetical protein PP7435_CHR1-2456 [Komagataella phaffii CBS 7435]